MPEYQRSSGVGAAFVLLLALGVIVMFWWILAIVLGVALLAGGIWYVASCFDARDAARAAIAARADAQHAQILAGDDRGLYGVYPPAA